MCEIDSRSDSPEPHEGPSSKRRKITESKMDDFENKLTVPIALELGEESRDLELKLLEKCLASIGCDIAQPAKCQCRCCLYTKYGHVVFVPHDAHRDVEKGPGEKCAKCISAEGTVRGQYAVEISDHLPLSPAVRHELACHFRVFREILSKMFSTTVQDLRKRMDRVRIENMQTLQEESLRLQEEINHSGVQLDALTKELQCFFDTMVMSGVDVLGAAIDLPMASKENMPTLVHLRQPAVPRAEPPEEEIKKLMTENSRLGKRIQQLEEEKLDVKKYGFQTVPIKFYTSDRNLDS